MGITVAVMRAAANTSTGTQDFTTTDLGGLTPKAAWFMMSSAITDGTAASDAHVCVGAATGATNEWAVTANDEDGQSTTDSVNETYGSRCIAINVTGTGNLDGDADFDSFITDGIRINWQDAPAAAYLLTVILFAGTDLSAHANTKVLGTQDTAVDVTDPGFTPDLVIATMLRKCVVDDLQGAFHISIGAAHYDGVSTIVQRSWYAGSRSGQATSLVGGVFNSSRILEQDGANVVATEVTVEISDFDANGFTLTARDGGGDEEAVFYLALNFGGVAEGYVGAYTTPTSTGEDTETGPGFKPQFVMLGQTMLESVDTYNTAGLGGQTGISVFDADDEFSVSHRMRDGVMSTECKSISDDRAIVLADHLGTLDVEATFVSFEDTGFILDYSNVATAAKQFWCLAIEEVVAGGAAQQNIILQAVNRSNTY